MLQKVFATGISFFCLQLTSFAQLAPPVPVADTLAPKSSTTISGFADCYYRYDPARTTFNNKTSFTNSHNSFELGMISAKLDQKFGHAGLTADVGFGRRAEDFSYADINTRFIIKQLFLSYTLKYDVKLSAGSWATHVGYEVVDAPLNRNYSMSYMFSYGPFFHTGVKAEKTFGRIGAMLGIANPTDLKSASFSNKYMIGQISATSKDEKLKVFLNFQEGKPLDSTRINQFDLVATYALASKFSIGANGTVYNVQQMDREGKFGSADKWWGAALYLNANPNDWLGITLRTEIFDDSNQLNVFAGAAEGGSVFANTLSFNFTKDNFILMPEIRFEKATADIFIDKDGALSDSALSFLCAAVYKF